MYVRTINKEISYRNLGSAIGLSQNLQSFWRGSLRTIGFVRSARSLPTSGGASRSPGLKSLNKSRIRDSLILTKPLPFFINISTILKYLVYVYVYVCLLPILRYPLVLNTVYYRCLVNFSEWNI